MDDLLTQFTLKPIVIKENKTLKKIEPDKQNPDWNILINNDKLLSPMTLSLSPPIQLFVDDSKANNTFIEPGVSASAVKAVEQIPGRNWIGKLASNGNREVAILVPQGVDTTKPVEIIYYFHGHNGKISESLTNKNYGLKDQIQKMVKQQRNIIVVVPQGPPKKLDYTWMNGKNKEDMAQFQTDTLQILKQQLGRESIVGSVTVKGHSAGGRPIMNAAGEGKLKADRIDFLDASYGTWATRTYKNYVAKNPSVSMNLYYIPGSQTSVDALSLKKKSGVTLQPVHVSHSAVPKTVFSL